MNTGLFPEEWKACHKGTRGTGDLHYIDQLILKRSKMRRKNVAIGWIDYKKDTRYGTVKPNDRLSKNIQVKMFITEAMKGGKKN